MEHDEEEVLLGELIPFPLPNIDSSKEETLEYYELKEAIKKAKTFREIHLKKRVDAFMKKVKDRQNQE